MIITAHKYAEHSVGFELAGWLAVILVWKIVKTANNMGCERVHLYKNNGMAQQYTARERSTHRSQEVDGEKG